MIFSPQCVMLVLAVTGAPDALARVRPPADLASRVVLTLTLDKAAYLQSEPVAAEIELKNISAEPVTGPFRLSPLVAGTRVHYSRAGEVPQVLTSGLEASAAHGFSPLARIEGGGRLQETAWLSFDNSRGQPPFDRPGAYAIYVTFRTVVQGGGVVEVRSNTARFDVLAPPAGEVEAHANYTPALAGLASWPRIRDEVFPEALTFVRRFPRSAYSRAIGHMVLDGVRERLSAAVIGDAERQRLLAALEEVDRALPPRQRQPEAQEDETRVP